MKLKLYSFTIFFIILSNISLAKANDVKNETKFFGKIYVGSNMLNDKKISQTGVASSGAIGDFSFSSGWIAGGALGYYFTNNLATEIGWDYRTNELNKANFSDGKNFNEGDFASNILFLNNYYNFNPIIKNKLRPYVGLGLGFVEEIDIDLNSGGIENSYSSNNNLTYQLIAGVAYSLNKDWDLTTDLRYMRINNITLKNEKGAGELRRIDYNPVSLSLGVMYKFWN